MLITRAQFDSKYAAGELRLAFIGMSNIGKSYTASRLSQSRNFSLIEVDGMIREALGKGSMADFADWQGQPYTEGYDAREAVSIDLETQATIKAMNQAVMAQAVSPAPNGDAGDTGGKNTLLDTTGSVIYIAPDALSRLKDEFLIVHIAAGEDDLERLKTDYFARPKPLVWRGHYRPQDGMSHSQSVLACYPDLLASRKQAYEALADVTLQSRFVLSPDVTMDMIYGKIREGLSPSA